MNANLVRKFPLMTLVLIGIDCDVTAVAKVARDLARGRRPSFADPDGLRRHVRDRLFLYGAWKL